ncbi:TnsA endonuclease N-terminal domain-containing protein [Microcoleus sp. FACHB-1515]|uniref:TnsA endonuclease N-terminal domain-containing protein n=1 Tax=Cyanophyceae TaxID=3028117 RepID=UPI001687CA67|nr:TnsA endonuclease N-terminal domain-containing protein [Microcoleus sp. FACHB-1515]MBD2088830.1 TnsA endonuclease N-terminal domain-containing protein [Microcoleus sp. FACHB-1515]
MARRNKKTTPEKIRKWIAEGRGQGRGADYKPWLTGQDVSVDSFSVRIKILEPSGRRYEALSLLEADYFKILSWLPNVVELREQYPLLPLETTQEIARKLGVEHPSFEGEPIVMTTDALISLQGSIGIFDVARAVKPSKKLGDPRVIEKLEIERHYW